MAEMNSPVTFSIGVVSFPRAPDSIDAMVTAADRLMYQVKRNGRNAAVVAAGVYCGEIFPSPKAGTADRAVRRHPPSAPFSAVGFCSGGT